MDEAMAEDWACALESGEYEQTNEVLRDQHGMCCIGVLLDRNKRGLGQWIRDGASYRFKPNKDIRRAATKAQAEANVYTRDLLASGELVDGYEIEFFGEIDDGYVLNKLGLTATEQSDFIYANDSLAKNFNEIAEMVRDKYVRNS